MNATNRLWHVAAALGLGLLAIVLTTFYVTNYKRHVQSGEAHVTVLVAAKDIPADTPGTQILAQHLLTPETVSRRAVVPGAISTPAQIQNLIATQPVYAGEQVTTRRFGTQAQRGIRSQITGTGRAFQVAGDANQLLAGTLRAGDHVDVVASWEFPESSSHHVSRTVLQGLLVLQAPSAPAHGSGAIGSAPNQGYSAQLALTDAQSQKLQWTLSNATWHFELRPPSGAADSPGNLETAGTMTADGVARGTVVKRLATP
jgi:Flp pilus assembly protein CpaB